MQIIGLQTGSQYGESARLTIPMGSNLKGKIWDSSEKEVQSRMVACSNQGLNKFARP